MTTPKPGTNIAQPAPRRGTGLGKLLPPGLRRQVSAFKAGEGMLPLWLLAEPRPLISPKAKLVISWSTKSACSELAIWHFAEQGILAEAMARHQFPHVYRVESYYGRPSYREAAHAAAAARGDGYTLLRVTRDPAKRLVSLYRHALRSKYSREPVQRLLGLDLDTEGVSLNDFVRLLGQMDLTPGSDTNSHFLGQAHPVWDQPFSRVVTINIDELPLHASLAALGADLGLRPVFEAEIAPYLEKTAKRYARDKEPRDLKGAIEDHRLTGRLRGQFPKAALQAVPGLESIAARLFPRDVGQVASGDTAGRLFQG